MIRQGDILFIPAGKLPDGQTKKRESGVVAEGEATGHHHRIAVEDMPYAELLEVGWRGDNLMLQVSEQGIRIMHEEHKTVTIPPGIYHVHQAREYDYLQQFARPVRD